MTTAVESGAYQRDDGLWVFPRREFAAERFDYKAGEHVTFGGPTQTGKTSLAFILLEYCATPDLPAYVAVSKPRDPVSDTEGKRLGFRRVADWPPTKTVNEIVNGNPPGYLIWPKFGDIDQDTERATHVTRKLLKDRYAAGVRNKQGIMVMDDTMVKSKLLGLDKEMTTNLAMSGAMGLGQWVFVQKPTDSGRTAIWSYGASEHVFLTFDPDRKNQLRYDEIGGVDPKQIAQASTMLKPYEFLYIKRTGRHLCIVGA
jgi:hypothetical protein